jgi:hypothetical protein
MTDLTTVKLCIDCRHRKALRDDDDRTPCAKSDLERLSAARAACGGDLFEPYAYRTERRIASQAHREISLTDLPYATAIPPSR